MTLRLNATSSEILPEINRLRSALTEKDLLPIHYAGRGELDQASATGYRPPLDAAPEDDTNWIANEALTRHFNRYSPDDSSSRAKWLMNPVDPRPGKIGERGRHGDSRESGAMQRHPRHVRSFRSIPARHPQPASPGTYPRAKTKAMLTRKYPLREALLGAGREGVPEPWAAALKY